MKKWLAFILIIISVALLAESREDNWGFKYEGKWTGTGLIGPGKIYDSRGLLIVKGNFVQGGWPQGYRDFQADEVLIRDTLNTMRYFGLSCPIEKINPLAITAYELSDKVARTVWFMDYCGKGVGIFVDYVNSGPNKGTGILIKIGESKIADLREK